MKTRKTLEEIQNEMKAYTVRFAPSNDCKNDEINGTGFVLTEDGLIATCSHVVQDKQSQARREARPEKVKLVFAGSNTEGCAEIVDEWWHPFGKGDIAILKLMEPECLPDGVQPAPLSRFSGCAGHAFMTFGYPNGTARFGEGKIYGAVPDQQFGIKIQQLVNSDDSVACGSSGAPILDEQTQRVVGMVMAIDAPDRQGHLSKNVLAVGLDELINICPRLEEIVNVNPHLTESLADSMLYSRQIRPLTNPNLIFGRQKELDRIEEFLKKNPSLAITGYKGTGKSTLASMYVDRVKERGQYTETQIFWRRMNKNSEISEVITSFFTVIGKPIQNITAYKNEEDLLALFFQELEKSPYLLVLDNFETLINPQTNEPASSGFSRLIEESNQMSGESRVLFTSWECPAGQVEWYQIGGLDPQAAMQLLQKIGVTGSENELKQVIERSNGHPQALKLLPNIIKRGYTLADMLADKSLWKGQVATRILDDVYTKRLSEEEQKLLQYVALYREHVPTKAIIAVAKNPEWNEIFTTNLAFNLNVKSLINKTGENYWEESIIQNYAYSKMADKVSRHKLACDYYQLLPVPEEPLRKEDVQPRIEAHYHACMAEEYDKAAAIIFDNKLHQYLDSWGNYRTLEEIYLMMLPKDDPLNGKPLVSEIKRQHYILGNLGNVYGKLGDYRKALKYYCKALKTSTKTKRGDESTWLGEIGNAYHHLGKDGYAIKYYKGALSIARNYGRKKLECYWLGHLGNFYNSVRNFALAIEYYNQGLDIAKDLKYKDNESDLRGNIGRAYNKLNNYNKAKENLQQALTILEDNPDIKKEGAWRGNLGTAYYGLGENKLAFRYYMQALDITKRIGDYEGEGIWLNTLGNFFNAEKKNREAIACYLLAKQIRIKLGNPQDIAETESNLKTLEEKLGKKESVSLQTAEEILRRILEEAQPQASQERQV